jgi:hypothetical protein
VRGGGKFKKTLKMADLKTATMFIILTVVKQHENLEE